MKKIYIISTPGLFFVSCFAMAMEQVELNITEKKVQLAPEISSTPTIISPTIPQEPLCLQPDKKIDDNLNETKKMELLETALKTELDNVAEKIIRENNDKLDREHDRAMEKALEIAERVKLIRKIFLRTLCCPCMACLKVLESKDEN